MKTLTAHILFISILFFIVSCGTLDSQTTKAIPEVSDQFNRYWYDGTAEITRYDLKQSRYSEVHEGDAVLIFVTEEFRTDKQVKYEGGDRTNVAPILKLNMTKKFLTGIYPYSIMTSIFSPTNTAEKTIKINTTTQEWCGHTFSQLNLDGQGYNSKVFSYFQNEGDTESYIKGALTEDGLWTTIRLNPNTLPQGEVNIIPGTQYLRLKHLPTKSQKAYGNTTSYQDESISDKLLSKYTLEYGDIDRALEIIYESEFPYHIIAWTESSKSGNIPATTAVRSHQIKTAYWAQNSNEGRAMRKQLGLE